MMVTRRTHPALLLHGTCVVLIAVSLFILISSCSQSEGHTDELLARVGEHTITAEDFRARYHSVRSDVNLPDNGQVRRGIFDQLVTEELLIVEARRRGYHNDAAGRYEQKRIEIQQLLDMYLRQEVFPGVSIHEEDLKTLYIRLNTRIKARHLYASTRSEADSLYTRLLRGESFEKLAGETFKDPKLRRSGGSLGYFTIGEMDPAFEQVAFGLKAGELSKPVQTAQGYSIIRVEDRITKPLLNETGYARHRDKLRDYLQYRGNRLAARAYVDSLRRRLDITFHERAVWDLYQAIHEKKEDQTDEPAGRAPGAQIAPDRELVRSRLGVWDVATFRKYARFTSEGQVRWIRNRDQLKDFIAGLIARAHMLSLAREAGWENTQTYRRAIHKKMDTYLLGRMDSLIANITSIPEDTLRTRFQRHRSEYAIPPKIQLSEISIPEKETSGEIRKALEDGGSFDALIEQYSNAEENGVETGDMGVFTRQDLGAHGERLFQLEVGEWAGPITFDGGYSYVKCTAKYPRRERTFEEARDDLLRGLTPFWEKKTRRRLVESIRAHVDLVTYPEKLAEIRLSSAESQGI